MQKKSDSLALRRVQRDLEEIYRLDQIASVEEFLISTKELQQYLPSELPARPQLLVREEEEGVSFGVHLGDDVLERVQEGDLETTDLSDFCSVVEEVSHFLYLAWSVKNKRPVSLLDVELQGEIDKFLLSSLHHPDQENLIERMFDDFSLHKELTEAEQALYRRASRLGAKFCRSLGSACEEGEMNPTALMRLRTFWRWATQRRLAEVARL